MAFNLIPCDYTLIPITIFNFGEHLRLMGRGLGALPCRLQKVVLHPALCGTRRKYHNDYSRGMFNFEQPI